MAKIEQWIIDRVKDAADIVDVVGDFVDLRKAGVNYTGLCPFHDDHRTGNFVVRPKNAREYGNTYHCFVCMNQGEGGGPVDFLMKHERLSFADAIRWLGKKYSIEVDNVPLNYTPPPRKPTPPQPPALVIPRNWVQGTMKLATDKILFIYWIKLLPWSDEQRKRLPNILWQYCVGGWPDGRVVFWQIDHEGIPRAAKLMRFYPFGHPHFGHRVKEEHPGWIYNQDGCRQHLDLDNHTVLKPLFGAHLLKRYPDAVVNVVESEKTALVMSTFYGNLDKQLWLACGGIKRLQLEAMQPLIDQGRTVWLWPDRDGQQAWQEVADKLGSDKVQVYTRFFETCWRPEDGDKADAADITIRMMTHGDKPKETKEQESLGATDQKSSELYHSGATQAPEPTWDADEPFLDPEEIADPRLHEWRMKLSRVHSAGWGEWPKQRHGDTQTVGEILKEHPLLKRLIE